MRILVTILLLIFAYTNAKSQLYFGNFVGEDSETVNGLGQYEVPFGFPIPLRTKKDNYKILFHPSYTLSHTYFSDKWVFTTDGNTTTYALDPDPNHEYRPSIFSHQSKIVTWSWDGWLGFEKTFNKVTFDLFYGASYIQVGSFRRRFVEGNEVVKVRDRFLEKADYFNINRFQNRVKASLTYYGIGLTGYLNLTPFFKSSTDIDLRKFGVTLMIRDNFWSYLFGLDDSDEEPSEMKRPDVKQMMF